MSANARSRSSKDLVRRYLGASRFLTASWKDAVIALLVWTMVFMPTLVQATGPGAPTPPPGPGPCGGSGNGGPGSGGPGSGGPGSGGPGSGSGTSSSYSSVVNNLQPPFGGGGSGPFVAYGSPSGGGASCPRPPTCSSSGIPAPADTSDRPVYFRYGAAYESATDLQLATPLGNWSVSRSYMSNGTGASDLGNKWLADSVDQYLIQSGSNVIFLESAASQHTFTGSGSPPTFTALNGATLELEHDSVANEYILTDTMTGRRDTFHDFTVFTAANRGKLKERSTHAWNSQSKSGFSYSYSSGQLTQITTPTGQDFNIVYTFSGGVITKIEVKNADMTPVVIAQVDYTYYGDVTTPSTDIGSSGDLVQVKVSTADTSGSLSIVRYTQYRYDSASRLKAVYEHDAIQRIIDQLSVTDEADLLKKDDDFGTPDVQDFANRRFTYYTANTATSSIDTPFTMSENLNSTYGGAEVAESGYVKTETILTGCGSCGSNSGITKTYFYTGLSQGTVDQNEVVRIVIEDTEDSNGSAHSRTVLGLSDGGQKLREAFIDDPTGTPTYWCQSWVMATTGQELRVGEHRAPSAHDVASASELRDFLDPYDSEGASWTNDTNTLFASDGFILVYEYDSTGGLPTASKVKKGRTGTAYYTGSAIYGDGDGDTSGDDHDLKTLVTSSRTYDTKTTTVGDGDQTTYAYTFWDSDDREIKTKTTTLPAIPTGQNGSGTATTMVEYYDDEGKLRWTQDGEGYINYFAYHPVTGALALSVIDIDPGSPGTDVTNGSSGEWQAWTDGDANNNKPSRSGSLPTALALATETHYDELGRQTYTVEQDGAEHHVVYENTRTLSFPYWDSTGGETLLPIRVSELGVDETLVGETYAVKAGYSSISTSSGVPTGFSSEPAQSDYVSWTRFTRDAVTGSLEHSDRYHDIPSSGTGTLSTNYYRTVTQTNALGRPEYEIHVVSGSSASNRKEQVTRFAYDVLGRVTTVKQGVSGDTAANSQNMTDNYNTYPTLRTVWETVYDDDGVGDGHVTKTRRYHGTGANDYTGVNYKLTYRGHVRGQEPFYHNGTSETAAGPYTVLDVDWRGLTTAQGQFTSAPTWSTVLTGDGYTDYASTTSTNRGSLTETSYDDLGRMYRTNSYAINTSTGAKGSSHRTDGFYDRNDRIVASGDLSGGAATEVVFDGAGRQYQAREVLELESTKYSSGTFQYRAPTPHPTRTSMTGGDDKVVTLSHSVFDSAGNVTEQHAYEMNHDDGTAGIDLSNNDDYVRRTVYSWYDDADRVTTTGDYGSGDTATGAGEWKYAAVPTRPGTAPTASSDMVLVTEYAYDASTGRMATLTDPAGNDTKMFYDDLARTTWIAEHYDDFDPDTLSTISDGTDDSKDRVTKTEYDGLSNTTKQIAYNGSSSIAEDTVYLYEDAVDAGRVTNTIYPDSSDTTSSGSDQVKITYNVDGTSSQRTDQRGTVIASSYDNLRRPQSQKVTTLGGATDGAVRSLTTKYDTLGRVSKQTSHGNQTDDPDNTSDIENQVVFTYNDLGLLTKSEQAHSGAVGMGTPSVQYAYDTSAASSVFDDGPRLESLTYPSGRVLFYDYGTADALADRLSAPEKLRETNGSGIILVEYSRTGSGNAVITDYQQPDVKLDLFGGTTGTYAGMDRFGRDVDHRWYDYTSGTVDRARYYYGNDDSGNRQWQEDPVASANSSHLDMLYAYDGLNRLTAYDRGDINGTHTAITTLAFAQDWELDQLNNWSAFDEDTDGDTTDDLEQDRTHNDANEITAITATTGANWVDPTYDGAGNMITGPTPGAETSTQKYVYDAWNRLVEVTDGSDVTQATFGYDARNHRIMKGVYVAGSLDHTRHYYHTEQNQVVEERIDSSTDPDRQYTWGDRYVDDLVLRTRDTDSNGSLDETVYALHDSNWSITALTDTSGAVVERFRYDAYGRAAVLDADFSADGDGTSDYAWEYRFTSREWDTESGLQYFRARYYDESTGRFINRDPIGYTDGMNLYAGYFVPALVDPDGTILGAVTAGCCAGCIIWLASTAEACWNGPCRNARDQVDCILDCMWGARNALGPWSSAILSAECGWCTGAALYGAYVLLDHLMHWCAAHPWCVRLKEAIEEFLRGELWQ